ncbi:YtxH domain-containing protein [Nocardioides pelophilus]|uniref:YtxH domain-containing protein n=1 Tax=Nocardioides pelophilus TaxID=2172019 RepID=UPI0015FF8E50|nr:YtxH domain-containing protein [Nocardioides pelophilus]
MSKISFLAGVGVGYVLGARAGRERYEQIKSGAQGAWNNPKVQETVSHAQDLAAQKAPVVQHKLAETASTAVHKVSEKVGSNDGTKEAGQDTPAGFAENPAK